MKPSAIDPERLYSREEARRLVPSCRAGKRVSGASLSRWVREGKLQAVPRRTGKLVYLFFWGAELLRFIEGGQPLDWNGQTPAERRRGEEAARQNLRERHGINA